MSVVCVEKSQRARFGVFAACDWAWEVVIYYHLLLLVFPVLVDAAVLVDALIHLSICA